MLLALKILLLLAVLAAIGAWVAGALAYMNVLSHSARKGGLAKALFAWPFAARDLEGPAAADAQRVNKAIVAFFAAILVAASAAALVTNLTRMLR